MTLSRSLRNSSKKIVDVIVENTRTEEEVYSFALPKTLIPVVKVGMRVFVPFGKGNKLKKGLVISIRDGDTKELKEVIGLVNPFRVIDEEGVKVLLEINKKYFIPVFKFIRILLPVGKGRGGKEIVKIIDEMWEKKLSPRERRKRELLYFIQENGGEVSLDNIKKHFPSYMINDLIKRGILSKKIVLSTERKKLTKEEKRGKIKFKETEDILDTKEDKIILIKGYTYRERWKLYIDSIKNSILRKRKIKLIFPERIDAVDFFKSLPEEIKNFGEILTGETSKSDRYRIYNRIEEKNLSFIVGTYFSLFLPLNEEKIIVDRIEYFSLLEDIIPNEFETIVLRYGELGNKKIIFGSFVPSLPTYYLSKKFKWKVISKTYKFPKIKLISNPHGILFTQSVERILKKNKKRKILLFLPRKGYFSFLYCSECGYVEKCPRCKIPLTYFKEKDRLVCKICGYEKEPFDTCPVCGGISMRFANPGTERVKDILSRRFRERKILELDESIVKSSRKKRGKIEKEFIEKGNILIGTQMIFPLLKRLKNFIFVFLDVDFLMNFPEYNASEKVFYTILRVIEEAKIMDGEVVIQTRTKENILFKSIKEEKPDKFIKREFWIRKEAMYPPYVKYIKIRNANDEIFKEVERISNDEDLIYYNKDEIIIKTKNILKFGKVFDKIRKGVLIEIKEF